MIMSAFSRKVELQALWVGLAALMALTIAAVAIRRRMA